MRHILLASASPKRFECDDKELSFDTWTLYFLTAKFHYPAIAAITSVGRATLSYEGKSFPFGPAESLQSRSGMPHFAFGPDDGDTVLFTYEQSRLVWPVFEANWLGPSALWRRYVYCRLRWTKRSGARLEILWRANQDYFAGGRGWYPKPYNVMTNNLRSVQIDERRPARK